MYLQGELPFPSPQHMTPEAVAQAMKVLEIHERLEHPDHSADIDVPADRLGNNEVEVLKEMCNVSTRLYQNCLPANHIMVTLLFNKDSDMLV